MSTAANTSTRRPRRTGLDTWLQEAGRHIPVGGTVRVRLVKGPDLSVSADPVDPKAQSQAFPAILKFPVSTVTPDFTRGQWKTSRLYQQDVPKPVDSEDEEAENTDKPKKKWKYNRVHATQRQWILQEQVDFLQTMLQRRQQSSSKKNTTPETDPDATASATSSRYEGTTEHNPSRYCLFSLNTTSEDDHHVTIRPIPTPQGVIAFSQPNARPTLTLSQAEQAIQDQRAGITPVVRVAPPRNGVPRGPPASLSKKKPNTQNRLLSKLAARDAADTTVDDGDDIMADVAFTSRKGSKGGAAGPGGSSNSRARTELLSTMGDGLTVTHDGVLGGANDAAFGGRQRFGAFRATAGAAGGAAGANVERGADGAAMADDFYTRDVQAEYDEMDYDANEQFDDDDVDVGETEQQFDVTGGYHNGEDDDEDDDDEEEEDAEDAVGGAAGLATVAGFKKLLAKARGEPVAEPGDETNDGGGNNNNETTNRKRSAATLKSETKEEDHISKIMAAADQAAQAGKSKAAAPQAAAASPAAATAAAVQVDDSGLRIISQEAVRREIWLNHGSIPISRLIKIFDAKKKHGADRQRKIRDIIKELCTMTNDPVNGRTLVLKQHYMHMN